jgi:hypothetical protein
MKRILLLVAGIVGLVIVVAGILLYFNRDKIAGFAMDRALKSVEGHVIAELPQGLSPDSVRAEFESLHRLLQSGTVTVDEIKDLAATYYTSMKDDRLDSAEVRQLVVNVRELIARHRPK